MVTSVSRTANPGQNRALHLSFFFLFWFSVLRAFHHSTTSPLYRPCKVT